jgi:hypothetical protein
MAQLRRSGPIHESPTQIIRMTLSGTHRTGAAGMSCWENLVGADVVGGRLVPEISSWLERPAHSTAIGR